MSDAVGILLSEIARYSMARAWKLYSRRDRLAVRQVNNGTAVITDPVGNTEYVIDLASRKVVEVRENDRILRPWIGNQLVEVA